MSRWFAKEKPIASVLADPLIGCAADLRDSELIDLYQPAGKVAAVEGYAAPAASVEWQHHWLHPIRLGTGRVVARLNETPLVVENQVGAGRVFFVTALNLTGCDAARRAQEPFLYPNILGKFLHTLHDHIGEGISFSPWTSLEYICNEKRDGTALLLVLNHSDMAYRRDVVLKNPRRFANGRVIAQGTWEAWRPGDALQFAQTGESLKWSFSPPPKSFVLFELKASL